MPRLDPKMLKQLGAATAAVSQWTVSIVLAVLFGEWLDNKLDSEPILLSICAFLGFIIGGYSAFQSFKLRNHDSKSQ